MSSSNNVIRRLDPCVVNKIAAGEVIQRPASALKEMLENSLDAGATQISVVVKEGGNKLLQITDTGHGIREEDLPVLCHRHTTSKLASFEDLETINTLGFRGEALCSISFVSNLTVTTMREGALHGYRASYKDSEMLPPGPKPVAAVRGTTITVEDLFYNVPTRRKALKSAAEEYARVMDVMTRYALMASGRCAFSCKRQGEARADVLTLPGASLLDNVRALYGAGVANNLLPLSLKFGKEPTTAIGMDDGVCLVLEGFISSASYAAKRTQMVLFINGRAVDCGPMRRALEAAYAQLLPKASKPFLYLDLRLPPRHVDVNTHPTKREVGFIHQEEITSLICEAVESTLSNSNTSRTMSTLKAPLSTPNTTMAGSIRRPSQTQMTLDGSGSQHLKGNISASQAEAAPLPYRRDDKLVRVDHMTQSLDAFFPGLTSQSQRADGSAGGGPERQQAGANPKAAAAAALTGSLARKRRRGGKGGGGGGGGGAGDAAVMASGELPGEGYYSNADIDNLVRVHPEDEEDMEGGGEGKDAARVGQPSRRGVAGGAGGSAATRLLSEDLHSCLDSIQGLAAEVDAACHSGLSELLRGHVYVGMADNTRALLQYRTKLYIVDLAPLSRELFYQQLLAQFEAVESTLVLDPAPSIRELMAMALALEQARGAWEMQPEVHDGVSSEQELCELVALMLMEKSPMLEEYLGMRIDDKGCLCSLPLLLPGWQPDLGGLCDLVLGLARDVVWEQEQPCFRGLAQVLADFLALKPPLCPLEEESDNGRGPPVPAHTAVAGQTDAEPSTPHPEAGTPNAPPTVTLTPPLSSQPASHQGAQIVRGEGAGRGSSELQGLGAASTGVQVGGAEQGQRESRDEVMEAGTGVGEAEQGQRAAKTGVGEVEQGHRESRDEVMDASPGGQQGGGEAIDWHKGEGMRAQYPASANRGALLDIQDRSGGEGDGEGEGMCIPGHERINFHAAEKQKLGDATQAVGPLGQQDTQQVPGQQETQQVPDQQPTQQVPDQQDTQQVPGQQDTQQVPGQQHTQQVPNQRDTQQVPGQQRSPPLPSEQLPSQPPTFTPPAEHFMTQGEGEGLGGEEEDVVMLEGSSGARKGPGSSTGGLSNGSNLSSQDGGRNGSGGLRASGGVLDQARAAREWTIKHVLLPAMRSNLRPSSKRASDGTCVEIAALERLYRIFERC